MKTEFWRDWKRKSKLEESAIKSVRSAKKRILNEIPKEKIHSIYAKGSFVRREMNKSSDVDLVVIVNDNKYIKPIKKLYEKCRDEFSPVSFGARSLWELKHNKIRYKSKKLKGRPYLFIKKLRSHKLIYGNAINPEDYVLKDSKIYLKNRINTFRELFIPSYKNKKIGFSGLIKQVFWLVEVEQEVKGNIHPDSWKGLDKSIKDENHIIHDTYKYRQKNPKDKRVRAGYIRRLNTYLNNLKKLI